jgi:acetyl-CoA carboxylase biotin carboxyl carrier protein
LKPLSDTSEEILKIEELKELLEFVSERNIAELELEEGGTKLKIRKSHGAPPEALPVGASVVKIAEAAAAESAVAEGAAPLEDGLIYITSPMVGTFYRQPEPGAEPFAREGDYVKKGQVLCIIEAMKLMNEIESEHEGQLVKCLVENGQPVQYGDQLFAVRGA